MGVDARLFEKIDLAGLDARSRLLQRTDQKYIARTARLGPLSRDLAREFSLLRIGRRHVFQYESVYFDHEYESYKGHLQGRRHRCKVRTRYYADSGECFVEVKLKSGRGGTVKRRMPYPARERFRINARARAFIRRVHRRAYLRDPPRALERVLVVKNARITLVAKDGGERITIDSSLRFETQLVRCAAPRGVVVIETKTRNGNGLADKILRRHGLRAQRNCSKYCLGVVQLGLVEKGNYFLPTLRVMRKCARG